MNLVQYKLERLDQRNAGLRGLAERWLDRTPLAFCAIGLMSGIVLEHCIGMPAAIWPAVLGLAAAMAAAVVLPIRKLHHPIVAAMVATIAFAGLGGLRLMNAARIDPRDISMLAGEGRMIADLRGRVAGGISIEDRSNWEFGRFEYENLSTTFDLEVMQARCTSGWEEVAGKVRVKVGEPIYDLRPGDHVQIYATLNRFKSPMNPGGFDSRRFYERSGVRLSAFVESRSAIEAWEPLNSRQPVLAGFQQWLRDTADRKLKRGRVDEDESDGLLEALLLGKRTDITPQTYEAFRRTGLLHYVSLSGMHIGIVIGAVWQFARVIGITRRRRAVLCIAAIVVFLILVPAYSPVLRAGAIGLVFCAAALTRRQPEPVNTLGFAAILILLWSPVELFTAGWQLSFACVLGILLFSRRLEMLFYESVSRLTRRNLSPDEMGKGLWRRLLRGTVALMATGLAAWLGGSGLMLYHFHNITPLASLWTAMTSPLMAAIMVLGYVKMMLSAIFPTLGAMLGPEVSWLSWGFIAAVKLMAKVSLSEIPVGRVGVRLVILYYVTILYMPRVHWPSARFKKPLSLAMVAVLLVSLGMLKWQRAYPSDMEFTCLSAGHGQAAVVRSPGGTFLFDCGSRSVKDCGRRIVLPLLRWQGAGKLDAVYLSHGDMDHCNGLPEVIAAYRPQAVFVTEFFEAGLGDYGIDAVLERSTSGLRRSAAAGPDIAPGQAGIRTIWPPAGEEAAGMSDNDKSMVTMLEFAGRRILISSDIERAAQRQILARYPELRADVVIAPHHGSLKSRLKGFIEALKPEAVIYSCDDVQRTRVLNADVMYSGAKAYFTSRDGAVTVRVRKDGTMTIETFLKAE